MDHNTPASWQKRLSQNNRFFNLQTAVREALSVERLLAVERLNRRQEESFD
jgi:hypothetical protein